MKSSGVKIAVIGAGSTYTPELVDGLIQQQARIPLTELALMDSSAERLNIIGEMSRRMLAHAQHPTNVTLTTDPTTALDGADIVIAQIRVGGMSARLLDEAIPPRYGVIGQETVGPGGIANAFRTIPVMLNLAYDIAHICPNAVLINFTNPSGMITETLRRMTSVNVIGLCNIPTDTQLEIARMLGVGFEEVALDYFGINHLSWVRNVFVKGKMRMREVLRGYVAQAQREEAPLFAPDLIEALGMIPSYYLAFYYNHPRMLNEQLQGPQSRAERVMEIEHELFELYRSAQQVEKPALLAERGGRNYSLSAARLIAAILGDTGETQIVSVPNAGTFSNLPPEAAIEVPCRIDAQGAHPLPAAPIPLEVRGLLEAVKASEQLAIQAAVTGDERTAVLALLANPLVPSYGVARSLLAALLAEHADYMPQFQFDD
ncbi:MAG: 6-phospho-beta-glucosidase [Anaerolineae bacterium]|nr:6-phospho-beta-glucosidase [Anaerolineae bacterium]